MGWRRRYRKPRPCMAQPALPLKKRDQFAKEFAEMTPPPECGYKQWEKLGWSDRKKTHAKQYAKLLQELQDAAAALKEFLNEDIHKKARHPQQLRKQLQDIDSYEEQYKAWEEQRKMYIDDMWHHQVRNEDDAHVAKTGRCCGPNRYGLIRGCQRRATDGNFCYQHAPKAYHFRR